jgi:hypothetical protein
MQNLPCSKSIARLINWLHDIFLRGARVPDDDENIVVPGWSVGGQYRHLTGPDGVGLLPSLSKEIR